MKLTPELASKYAAYRDRYLGGPIGTYAKFPTVPDPCANSSGRRYSSNGPAPFMIISGNAATDEGVFLNVDRLNVGNDVERDQMETSSILEVHFGDNTVYSSIAMLGFVAEYAITQQSQSLEIAIGIARSWQRLGSKQRGWGEQGSAPFGFVLRSDSLDDAIAEENICSFRGGTGPAAFGVAPSFDQYAAVLSNISLTVSLLNELPADAQNDQLRSELRNVLRERAFRIVEFLAFRTTYTIRWEGNC